MQSKLFLRILSISRLWC